MKETKLIFTYTAQQRMYWGIVGVWLAMVSVEGSILILLLTLLVHPLLLKILLLVAMAALLLFLVFHILLAALWTKHIVTHSHLLLHYGPDRLDIPLAAIATAQPVHEHLNALQTVRGQLDAKNQRVIMAFSEQGQVLLTLKYELQCRIGRSNGAINRVLLNVDRRDEFLIVLNSDSHVSAQAPDVSVPITIKQVEGTKDIISIERIAGTYSHSSTYAIQAEQLTRHYGKLVSVDTLNLAIPQGEIYGFLGQNGAGKTTTIKMLAGLLEPTSGYALIAGHDVWQKPLLAKRAYGYVPDRAILYERLTGREFLSFLAQMRSLPLQETDERITDLLQLLDLAAQADVVCATYSFGMKRKLALAAALLHRPAVLLLDEPLNGLDPRSTHRLKQLFVELANNGTSILLSTHDLATAEAVCHRVGILHHGRLIAEGKTQDLRAMVAVSNLEEVFLNLTEEQVVL